MTQHHFRTSWMSMKGASSAEALRNPIRGRRWKNPVLRRGTRPTVPSIGSKDRIIPCTSTRTTRHRSSMRMRVSGSISPATPTARPNSNLASSGRSEGEIGSHARTSRRMRSPWYPPLEGAEGNCAWKRVVGAEATRGRWGT